MVSQHVSSLRGSCQPQMSIPLLTLLPPPQTIAHMALEDCPPQNKGVGGFCGGRATKHSRYNGESGWQVQLAHTLNCSLYEPSVLEQS